MIELQPFINVKNVKKIQAEPNIAGQRVKDRDMKDYRQDQEDTEVRDTGSWR